MATQDASKHSFNASFRKAMIDPFMPSRLRVKSSPTVPLASTTSIKNEAEELTRLEYGSLDPSKKIVRLLEILPGRNFEPISAVLSVCDLDEKPEYIALSYMWDKGDRKRHLECQGTKVEVGENLWQFLQQYRARITEQKYHEKDPAKPRLLWIDAISINQSNVNERSRQVSLMRDIYRSAESVVVWLGLAEGHDELAFLLTRYPHLLKVEEMLAALVGLLSKSYWSRVWVVQEVVLGRRVDMWCGDFQADFNAVEKTWQKEVEQNKLSVTSSRILTTLGYTLFQKRKAFRRSQMDKREMIGQRSSKTLETTFRLRDLLESFDTSQSSEPFDKVYGFLGVAHRGHGQPIRPDYSKPPVALLVDVLVNQLDNTVGRGEEDNYKFLHLLRRTLGVTRMELGRYLLQNAVNVQPYMYVLAASEFMVASVSFVSTVVDIGPFVDKAEAFAEGTWKMNWTRPCMHPKSLLARDILDLGELVGRPETSTVLSFAEPHVPGAPYLGRAELMRRGVIAASTEPVLQGLVQTPVASTAAESVNESIAGTQNLRAMFTSSMLHAGQVHTAARLRLGPHDRYERYASFVGTNGITGLVCVSESGTYEMRAGDRICTFSGLTDSNNAFIARLDGHGKCAISGFARILLPETAGSEGARQGGGEAPAADCEALMCFHCHLTDLLELQRCRILDHVQMERLVANTLRGVKQDEVHRCTPGLQQEQCCILEFGT